MHDQDQDPSLLRMLLQVLPRLATAAADGAARALGATITQSSDIPSWFWPTIFCILFVTCCCGECARSSPGAPPPPPPPARASCKELTPSACGFRTLFCVQRCMPRLRTKREHCLPMRKCCATQDEPVNADQRG